VAQNFTTLAEPLGRAIASVQAIGLAPTGRYAASRPRDRGVPGADDSFAQSVLFPALGTLVDAMGAIRGRKSLVFFTANFPSTATLDTDVAAMVAACNRANVVVYVIDTGNILRNLTEQTGGR